MCCASINTKHLQDQNLTEDMLDIIGCLFKNGADPTVKCKVHKTPRDVAIQNNFKLRATLIGNLNYIIV